MAPPAPCASWFACWGGTPWNAPRRGWSVPAGWAGGGPAAAVFPAKMSECLRSQFCCTALQTYLSLPAAGRSNPHNGEKWRLSLRMVRSTNACMDVPVLVWYYQVKCRFAKYLLYLQSRWSGNAHVSKYLPYMDCAIWLHPCLYSIIYAF